MRIHKWLESLAMLSKRLRLQRSMKTDVYRYEIKTVTNEEESDAGNSSCHAKYSTASSQCCGSSLK
jgi:hypothetical protein